MCNEEFPAPGDPGELRGCPTVARKLSKRCSCNRDSAPLPRMLADGFPANVRPNLTNLDNTSPLLELLGARSGSDLAKPWPKSANLDPTPPKCGPNRRMWAEIGQMLAKVGQDFAHIPQKSPKLGQVPAPGATSRQLLGNLAAYKVQQA